MNLFQELRQRRVPQISSAYIVASWGIIQFFDFLESRMAVSPNLVNLVGIGLVLLLPSVVLMAWVHGRPGRDSWGRIPAVLVPANLLAIVLLLFFMFRGQDLGAITKTIEVQDENGAVSERVVPKSQFRRRVLIFYPENIGDAENDWARETINILQGLDLNQDVFVDPVTPMAMVGAMQDAGSDDGHLLNRSRQRKMANDAHLPYFLTSTINFENKVWTFSSELHESESGRVLANRTTEADDIFTLVDLTSRQIREDLEIPSSHLESSQDLPVAELSSNDLEALKSHVKGLIAVTHENDWAKAAPLFDDAVEKDAGYTMAHFLRFAVYQTLGDAEKSNEAITLAMENLYRVPERTSFMIKSQYYYSVKQDADKSMAVLKMWSKIYPNDVEAYNMQALYYFIRQDLPNTITAYENILAIDPSQVKLIRKIASLHQQSGNLDQAEKYYLRFVEMFPTDTKGYRDLADFYSSTGQLDRARDALEKAQIVDPSELDIVLGLVDVDIKSGKFEESAQVLDEELGRAKTERDRLKILIRQMTLSGMLGKTDQLILVLESFHLTLLEVQNPMQADLIYSMLLPQVSWAGKPEAALQRLDLLVGQIISPYDKLVGVGRAWTLVDLGRTEEAKTTLAEAAELVETFKFETFRSSLALVGGMVAEKEGDLVSAVPLFRTAHETTMEMQPLFPIRLGRALRKNSQPEEAREVLESALETNPSHPELHLELALVMRDLGQSGKAREHLKTAQDAWSNAHPDFPPALRAQAFASEVN